VLRNLVVVLLGLLSRRRALSGRVLVEKAADPIDKAHERLPAASACTFRAAAL
jgi:hypothetical protein